MRMPTRLCGCRRAADTSAGLPHLACPAGVGQRARRGQALSAIRRPRRAGKDYRSLRGIFTNRRCGPAPFPLAALSNLEIPGQGSGMTPLRRNENGRHPCRGQWAGGRPGRHHAGPRRARTARGWHLAPRGPATAGCARRRARGQPGRGPDGKARPWPRPRTGLDRPLAARNWPRFLRDRAGRIPAACWPYPCSLAANPDKLRSAPMSAYGPGTPSR